MTETNTEPTEEEKMLAAKQEAGVRRLVDIQLDVKAKRARENDWKRLSSMSPAEFRQFTIENFGFE